jgi:hypothetical protein
MRERTSQASFNEYNRKEIEAAMWLGSETVSMA